MEMNKEIVIQDLKDIIEHLILMNNEMQRLYKLLLKIVMEATKNDKYVSESK